VVDLYCKKSSSHVACSSSVPKAVEKIKVWKPKRDEVSDDEKLLVYALFKQATVGDCNTQR